MTVAELIKALQSFENQDQEIFVWDGYSNLPVKSVSLFNSDTPESVDNPLGINLLHSDPF